jgi:hypothetical protein
MSGEWRTGKKIIQAALNLQSDLPMKTVHKVKICKSKMIFPLI